MTHVLQPDELEAYFLGDRDRGEGLLDRLRARVRELSKDVGPSMTTGSIMVRESFSADDSLADDGDTPALLDLALSLLDWKGRSASESDLVTYLRRSGLTDASYLLGGLLGQGARDRGLLSIIRTEVSEMVTHRPIPDASWCRLIALAQLGRAWLGACEHPHAARIALHLGFPVYQCPCGARWGEDERGRRFSVPDGWLEQAPKRRKTG